MREKRDCQVGILAACCERLRPMSLRKVEASGTKGVGWGIGGCEVRAWRWRRQRARRDFGRRHCSVGGRKGIGSGLAPMMRSNAIRL